MSTISNDWANVSGFALPENAACRTSLQYCWNIYDLQTQFWLDRSYCSEATLKGQI